MNEPQRGRCGGQVIQDIKADKIKTVDLNSNSESSSFIAAFKSNLGSYLLLKGLVAIEQNGKAVTTIVPDESPEMEGLDGTTKTTIFFAEQGSEAPVFLGDINKKVKQVK